MSFHYLKEIVVATCLLCVIAVLVSFMPLKFDFVKPIKQEFDDFDIYDLFYEGKPHENHGEKDDRIIIIQAAGSRQEIDSQIIKIKSLKPAVIGVDLSFEDEKDPVIDKKLRSSLQNDNMIVTGYTLNEKLKNRSYIPEKLFSPDYFIKNGGYINFSHDDSNAVIRSFAPFHKIDGKDYLAFSTQVLKKYAPDKFDLLKKRKNETEFINYYGNLEYYRHYTATEFEDLFENRLLGNVKDKIVLLGFFSGEQEPYKIMEDIRFTPLNEKINGKSYADMYGVVIHANILSMLLKHDDYVWYPGFWTSLLINFCVCFFIIWYIFHSYKKYGHPSHIRFFIFQVITALVVLYLSLKFFDWFNIRIDILFLILTTVICIEMFDIYKKLAVFFNRHCGYKTIFSNENISHI